MPDRPPFLLKIVDGSLVMATNLTCRGSMCLNAGRPLQVGGPSLAPDMKWSPWSAVGGFLGFDWKRTGPTEAWWGSLAIHADLRWFGSPRADWCSQGVHIHDVWKKRWARVCLDRDGLLWLYERGHTLAGDRLILTCQGVPPTYTQAAPS